MMIGSELVARMRWEPELFSLVDGRFIKAWGETVLVRCIGEWRWSIVVRGGSGNVVSYERLGIWLSWMVYRAARRVSTAETPFPPSTPPKPKN